MNVLARLLTSSISACFALFTPLAHSCEEGYVVITIRRDGTVTANPVSVLSEAKKAGGLKALVERDIADRKTLIEDKDLLYSTKSTAVSILDKNIRIARCYAALEK
jgi:hypothetical protein